MSDASTPITASATIAAWLEHPRGGPVLRAFLERTGTSPDSLGPALDMPLQQLVPLSRGELPQSAVDDMVRAANDGEIPADATAGGGADRAGRTDRSDAPAGRFAGRTVVVTGAAGGIGRATAERLLAEGARVVATDISAERLEALANETSEDHVDRLVTVVGDLGSALTIDAILAAAGERVDALANVAGINDDFSAIHEVSDEMWTRVLAVNVGGLVALTRAVTTRMLETGGGAIVHVASEAGLRGSASGVAYTASKHAVIGITPVDGLHVREAGDPHERRGAGRGRDGHPDAAADRALRQCPARGGAREHPVPRHGRAARLLDPVPALRGRLERQRRGARLRRGLVGGVTGRGIRASSRLTAGRR